MSEPIGFQAAKDDWSIPFAGREMTTADWNELTLGEQRRYAMAECKTKGAIYHSKISAHEIEFRVSLPETLTMHGLTSSDAEKLERFLHRKLEEQIVAILQIRQMETQP